MTEKPDWKTLTFITGGAIGLITGLAAAYLIIKQREETGAQLKLTSGEGAKIGLGIVTLLKLISDGGKG